MLIIREIQDNIADLYPFRQVDLEYYRALKSDHRRAQWLASRVAVWEELGCYIDTLANGAPQIPNGYISISHTQNWVAVITSDCPVGIDIEELARDCSRVVRKYTDDGELAVVAPAFPANPPLLVWCVKEALYKYASREGAEFLNDFRIKSMSPDNRVVATALGSTVELTYQVRNSLLVVYTNSIATSNNFMK
ncbi:Siderophore (Surfactin) biosynthesis regulatory protein [Mucinivorans hirudinis]|uniref:Siderophore (Surfactin) biosynthesis regulatory protein n=1 Tax=Mucinivorans hirudinis TaxID=1433126 RepID=A0A060RD85_9BACT|nr:Siderophore (Surfactin) biosynthesis regulatory protein [Mucinivorans hirudinis]